MLSCNKMKFLSSFIAVIHLNNFIVCNETKELQLSYNPAKLLSNIFGNQLANLNKNENTIDLGEEIPVDNSYESRQNHLMFYGERPLVFDDTEQDLAYEMTENQNSNKKKRRRRRRKPKNQMIPHNGYLGSQRPGQGSFGSNPAADPGYPAIHQPFYRPSRFQKPTLGSEALSSISDALTSIALYDDHQCVPRLLCEAAGGGKLSSASLLQPIAGLQPLFTLLSAYNGISSSPLFVFGRAVILGMTSKGNPGPCRYAYPQCPTDPEQLIHYLNNHNGGFFRFFNAPQGQQGLDQFYNQLSGSYGLYQPNLNQNYNSNDGNGVYQANQQNGLRPPDQGGYGLYNPNAINNQQAYGSTFKHDTFRFENNNDIEKRILNSPSNNFLGDDEIDDENRDTKLSFPESNGFYQFDNSNFREIRKLKFPDETIINNGYQNNNYDYHIEGYKRRGKSILFPDSNTHRYKHENKYSNQHAADNNINNYLYDNEHNFYVKKTNSDDQLRTVYIVRGNGDPNHPEIVKVKPGESAI